MEREAELERLRLEEEARVEAERIRREEEEERRIMEETERLAEEARKAEEERIQKAIEVSINIWLLGYRVHFVAIAKRNAYGRLLRSVSTCDCEVMEFIV